MIRYQIDVEEHESIEIERHAEEWLHLRGDSLGYNREQVLAAAMKVGLLYLIEAAHAVLAEEAGKKAEDARLEWEGKQS